MKKFKILLFVFVVAICGYNIYSEQKTNDQLSLSLVHLESMAHDESGNSGCRWKVIDCPGWGNGSYEACLTNGDGSSCSCGSVTRECPKD